MKSKELPINVAMEYAKNDYVKSINEITSRYKLPMCLVETIIGSIFFEIKNISRQELENNIKNLENEKIKKEEREENGNKNKNSNNG